MQFQRALKSFKWLCTIPAHPQSFVVGSYTFFAHFNALFVELQLLSAVSYRANIGYSRRGASKMAKYIFINLFSKFIELIVLCLYIC